MQRRINHQFRSNLFYPATFLAYWEIPPENENTDMCEDDGSF